MHDVIVVGAGFTGLSAALELRRLGADPLVLEAQGRVGGRVESRLNGLGERIDTGGQFFCDDMPDVMALLAGDELVSPDFSGRDVSVPPAAPARLAAIERGATRLRDRYLAIDPDSPAIRGLTVGAWLELQPEAADEKAAFRSMIEGLWCQSLEDVPLWFMIDNDRRITNEQYELQHFPARTMHALAEELAAGLGDAVRLSAPVGAIAYGPGGVGISSSAGEFRARAALVATPPSMALRLSFAPGLPAPLEKALAAWRSGSVIKLVIRYERAFWRDRGLSGTVLWRDPVGLYACDTGPADRPALSAFIGGPSAREWRRLGQRGVREAMLEELASALGPEAARPLDVVVRDWCDDPWSGGAYSDLILDMDARDAEAVIAAGVPPLHFACSEISPSFPGYMEGAIVAGRLAAGRIIAALET